MCITHALLSTYEFSLKNSRAGYTRELVWERKTLRSNVYGARGVCGLASEVPKGKRPAAVWEPVVLAATLTPRAERRDHAPTPATAHRSAV